MPSVESYVCCPKCNGGDVKIIDKGLKRLIRLLAGSSRYLCRSCKSTWRRHKPDRVSRVSGRRTKLLPVFSNDGWETIAMPSDQWQTNMRRLIHTVNRLLENGSRMIMVDMSLPQAFNTASFGVFLKAYKECRARGGLFKLCNLATDMADAFRMTSLEFLVADFDGKQAGPANSVVGGLAQKKPE